MKMASVDDSIDNLNMECIDRCIMLTLKELETYCMQKSDIAVSSCLNDIDTLIDFRFQPKDCFKNPKYIELYLARQKMNIDYQRKQTERDKIQKLGQAAADKYNDPNYVGDRRRLENEVIEAKKKRSRIDTEMLALKTKLDNINEMLSQMEMQTYNENEVVSEIYKNELAKALQISAENLANLKQDTAISEKLVGVRDQMNSQNSSVNENLVVGTQSKEKQTKFLSMDD